ncbi:sulfurtransferase complex subunit TusC [Vibrio agarilyticus]|uniref:sulfurtransferase complex subunit TusC n=1 Tax=Vibrio agarilyticus TaxID=2726741 RepID=UPI001B3B1C2D|nr:sulfurtransferase complex subunit TusC [Vibrio agarilyticus]
MSVTFVFTSSPHDSAAGREGVDAVLAASAYSEDIQVIFIGDGVLQLLKGQQPQGILSKDYAPMFKLFELYDIECVYVARRSLDELGVAQADLVCDASLLDDEALQVAFGRASKVLTF